MRTVDGLKAVARERDRPREPPGLVYLRRRPLVQSVTTARGAPPSLPEHRCAGRRPPTGPRARAGPRGSPLYQLHDQEVGAVFAPHVVQHTDVRIVEARDRTGLALEAGA